MTNVTLTIKHEFVFQEATRPNPDGKELELLDSDGYRFAFAADEQEARNLILKHYATEDAVINLDFD